MYRNREIQMPDFLSRPVILPIIALLAFVFAGGDPSRAQTLSAVKERGSLNCGVGQGLLGFSSMDEKKEWTGFDVDICRAVAAAIFGDPAKVTFVPLDAASRFSARTGTFECVCAAPVEAVRVQDRQLQDGDRADES